jgi:hypothetical protein
VTSPMLAEPLLGNSGKFSLPEGNPSIPRARELILHVQQRLIHPLALTLWLEYIGVIQNQIIVLPLSVGWPPSHIAKPAPDVPPS